MTKTEQELRKLYHKSHDMKLSYFMSHINTLENKIIALEAKKEQILKQIKP